MSISASLSSCSCSQPGTYASRHAVQRRATVRGCSGFKAILCENIERPAKETVWRAAYPLLSRLPVKTWWRNLTGQPAGSPLNKLVLKYLLDKTRGENVSAGEGMRRRAVIAISSKNDIHRARESVKKTRWINPRSSRFGLWSMTAILFSL